VLQAVVLMKEIEVNVSERILKPAREVFAKIVDPAYMAKYVISGGSGPMRSGTTVEWEFADVGAKVLVNVIEADEEKGIIAFETAMAGPRTRVTIRLTADDASTTALAINEAPFPSDEDGVKRALGQTGGWTHFVCSLKAYAQFGVSIRAGLNKRITST
jgi:uncharacterized protein YndB with AHSA1/START domain